MMVSFVRLALLAGCVRQCARAVPCVATVVGDTNANLSPAAAVLSRGTPVGLAFAPAGLYASMVVGGAASAGAGMLLFITASGAPVTVAGGVPGAWVPTGLAIASPYFGAALAVHPLTGAVHFFTTQCAVQALTPGGALALVAGGGPTACGVSGDGGAATAATIGGAAKPVVPGGLAFAPSGALFVADSAGNNVRLIGVDGIIRTFAGSLAGVAGRVDGVLASAALLRAPQAVALVGDDVYIADTGNVRVVVVRGGALSTVFQYANTSFVSNVCSPMALLAPPSGELLVADYSCLQVVSFNATSAQARRFVGTTAIGAGGDGGPAAAAAVGRVVAMAADAATGNVALADAYFAPQPRARSERPPRRRRQRRLSPARLARGPV